MAAGGAESSLSYPVLVSVLVKITTCAGITIDLCIKRGNRSVGKLYN